MPFAQWIDDAWCEVAGDFLDISGDDPVQRSLAWIAAVNPAERAAAGLIEIVEPGTRPTEVEVTGQELVDDAGVPTRVWTSAPYPLADARAIAWERARRYRDSVAEGGCDTPRGRVDTDPDSQRKINGAVTGALVAQLTDAAFPAIDWTSTTRRR